MADTVRDGGEYLRLATLSPAIAYDFGRSGATSLSTELSYRDYRNESAIEPLKRGGLHVGVTVEHFVELWPDAIGRLAGLWWRTDTDASAVPAFGQNFDGDYDHDGWGVASRLTTPLAWGVELEVLGSLTGAHYANDNFIAALATGDLSRKRRDLIVNAGVSFTRPIHRHVELELAYGFTDRDSNVPDFDYDRQIFRLGLRATFD